MTLLISATSHPSTSLKCRSTASAKKILVVMKTAVDAVEDATRATVEAVDKVVVVAVEVREKVSLVAEAVINVGLVAYRTVAMIVLL